MPKIGFANGRFFISIEAIQAVIPENDHQFVICAVKADKGFKTYPESRLTAKAQEFGPESVFKVEKCQITCMTDLLTREQNGNQKLAATG